MEFRILGPVEVWADGRKLPLGGVRLRALLAALLLDANRVVSAERLIDALWDDEPPEGAAKALQVYVSRLRKELGPDRIRTQAPGYVLRVEPGELDAARFEQLVSEGGGDGGLEEALALWRGQPLADLADKGFARAGIGRLEELRLAALEARFENELALGRHAPLAGELEALVREHPLRERLREQLMLALYRSGRQAEALDAYQQAREALVEGLGIDPGKGLRDLHQAVLRQDPGLDLAVTVEPAIDTARGIFVGRETELAELLEGLGDALSGRGRLFLVAGEPGIGKSRLADEVIRHAEARGARILVGRCWEAGGAPAYWPWVQSLRTYLREQDHEVLRTELGQGAADLAQILPEVGEIVPDLPELGAVESEDARFRLFDAAASFLRRASAARPILLVLDDLHAADEPSLLLLQFVARELAATRILVLAAFRDVDPIPGPGLSTMLAEVTREPVTRRLSLKGLSEPDVADYVELTAADLTSPQLVAALHAETEGNALFMAETVRLLAAEGLAPSTETGFAIPQSVRDVIARRLARLSEECNGMLVFASVLGREFSLGVLARVSSVSEAEVLDVLDEAMAARVITDVPGVKGHLRFAHVLIRDALYEGLTTARRVRCHRLAVEALEGRYGREPGPHLAELAHHAVAGSDFERGLDYASRAGDWALALLAYEEATRLYQTALEALELTGDAGESARCELLLSLGEAQIRAGDSEAAKATFLEAADIARREGPARALARAAVGYGGRVVWVRGGGDSRLVPLLEEGLAALGDEDIELRVVLLARLSGALRDEHSRERRDALSREAVELARRSGNPATLAYALDGRASAIQGPDTVNEILALGTELIELAERSADRERIVSGRVLRVIAELVLGDVRAAEADLEAASRVAHELGQPAQLWQVDSDRAMLALAMGRLDEAEELVSEGFAWGQRAVPHGATSVYHLQRYTLRDFRGGVGEMEATIRALIAEYPARVVFRCVLAHLHSRSGRRPEATRALEELAEDGFGALPFDQEWLLGTSYLAETAAFLEDADSAAVLYRSLLPWSALVAVDVGEGFRGSVARYLGLLATTMGRWDDSEEHFEAALELNDRMGARPWLARTQEDYGRMLLARDAPGDPERAQDLFDAARRTYRELGMEPGL